jgi:molybdopterin converting factor small subunit
MKIKVLLFAAAREIAGEKEVLFEQVAEGTDAKQFLSDGILTKWPALKRIIDNIVLAVNQEYIDLSAQEPHLLKDGV